mgnify:CR=1 FL=1
MAGSRREIIKAKQRVFEDWGIKWDAAIEQKLQSEMEARPNADPEVILDRITHDIIQRRIESL